MLRSQVTAVAFSPKGTYLATFQRPAKQEGGGSDKNLKARPPAAGTLCRLGLMALHVGTLPASLGISKGFRADCCTAVALRSSAALLTQAVP